MSPLEKSSELEKKSKLAKNSELAKKSRKRTNPEQSDELPQAINEVRLIGRISSEPVTKILPSGDQVVEFRLVVGRLPAREGNGPQIDTLDIAAWSARARRSALSQKSNTWVEIHGAVRRRFWQAPTGLASRWQVEATEIKRIKASS